MSRLNQMAQANKPPPPPPTSAVTMLSYGAEASKEADLWGHTAIEGP